MPSLPCTQAYHTMGLERQSLHLRCAPCLASPPQSWSIQEHACRRAGTQGRRQCFVDRGSHSLLEADASNQVFALEEEVDTQPPLGYATRRDARQHAQALAPNPLASPPVLRLGTFPHSTRLEDGGALTSLMIARAIGTTVEQVGLGSVAADPTCSQASTFAGHTEYRQTR